MKTLVRTDRLYINGEWVSSTSSETIDVVNAATEEVIATVPAGTREDVDKAVAAAKAAFPAWSALPVEERTNYLRKIAEGLEARRAELVDVITQEVGCPTWMSDAVQVGISITDLTTAADIVDEYEFEEKLGPSIIRKEPVGVVAQITPWNYPLHQITVKVAPALAVGCTVIVKPSEVAPLDAFILAEVIDEVGLPAGVFNLLTGVGPEVGEAMASHPDVDMVSLTGSTRAGRRVSELAAQTVKRVTLELGGKSPNVILDDADLAQVIPNALERAFPNAGQTCAALTRLIVPRSKLAEVESLAAEAVKAFTVGDPYDESTKIGPLISEPQWNRVQGYINKGIEEGAKLVVGGPGKPEGLDRGYYVKPTIFSEVSNDMTIAKEEIFGPVLSIIPYDTEEEAIEIANDTEYGLSGGVWSADPERARDVARKLRTGQVAVNGGVRNPLAPFGGFKQSGNGREFGPFGVEEYLEVKAFN